MGGGELWKSTEKKGEKGKAVERGERKRKEEK